MVSEHTVHRHVTNILRKLDLPTRTAAATVAVRAGLLENPLDIANPGHFRPARRWAVPAKPRAARAIYGGRMEMREVAALATLREMGEQMQDRELKAATRAVWALGDYHTFATSLVWELGPRLVAACGIGRADRVLDVAAGTGNVAIRAAQAGAEVTASDLTPENFDAGRREARRQGVELEWVEADAEELPFGDGEFDVVTSSLGAIFAPEPSGGR